MCRWNEEKSLQYKRGLLQGKKDQNIITMYSEKGLSGTHRTERTFGTGNKAGKSGKMNEFQNCFKKLVKKC